MSARQLETIEAALIAAEQRRVLQAEQATVATQTNEPIDPAAGRSRQVKHQAPANINELDKLTEHADT